MFLMDYFLAGTLFLSCGRQAIDSEQKETQCMSYEARGNTDDKESFRPN